MAEMNLTSLKCFSIYDDVIFVSTKGRAIITFFYALLSLVNGTLNAMTIYNIIKTKQWKVQSMRLILYISIGDLLYATFGYAGHVIHIWIPEHLECYQRRWLVFIPHFFTYFAMYMVMFIATDRFFHVQLLSKYSSIVTPMRFNVLLFVYMCVVFFQSFVTTWGPVFFGKAGGAQYSSPLNLTFIIVTFLLYVYSIIKLRKHARVTKNINGNARGIIRLATLYLAILVVCYLPLMLFTAVVKPVRKALTPGQTNILIHILLLLSKCNSGANALAYLHTNKRARRRIGPDPNTTQSNLEQPN